MSGRAWSNPSSRSTISLITVSAATPEDRAVDRGRPSHDDPDQHVDHGRHIELVRVHRAEIVREQGAGQAREERGDDEGEGPVSAGIDPHRFRQPVLPVDRVGR